MMLNGGISTTSETSWKILLRISCLRTSLISRKQSKAGENTWWTAAIQWLKWQLSVWDSIGTFSLKWWKEDLINLLPLAATSNDTKSALSSQDSITTLTSWLSMANRDTQDYLLGWEQVKSFQWPCLTDICYFKLENNSNGSQEDTSTAATMKLSILNKLRSVKNKLSRKVEYLGGSHRLCSHISEETCSWSLYLSSRHRKVRRSILLCWRASMRLRSWRR